MELLIYPGCYANSICIVTFSVANIGCRTATDSIVSALVLENLPIVCFTDIDKRADPKRGTPSSFREVR